MKKRLLLVTGGFPYGESERSFLSEEAKHLAAAFHLLVMAPETPDKLLYPTDGIVKILRYHIPSLRKSLDIPTAMNVFHPSTFTEVWNCCKKTGFSGVTLAFREIVYFRFCAWEIEKQLAALMESEQIDIIYTYWCTAAALAAANLKKRFPRIKFVTRFHGMDLYEERSRIGWQPFRNQIMHCADGLLFACEYGRNYFMNRWGKAHTDKMRLCYLGSTDRGVREMPERETLRILSCSNLIPLKRVELIIEGISLLPEEIPVQWDIFGDGPERARLEALADEKLGHRANTQWKFHGFVPNAVLTESYRKLSPRVFITTSSTEGGAPVSIQEVFSMGIPAIGTDVGGIPDLVLDGRTGFLIPEHPVPAQVAAAIEQFASLTREEELQMRAAVRDHWAQKFNAVSNAAHFTRYLLDMVSK